ncbi:MAG: hypothetical protein WCJ56_00595 [bacterium]
MIRITFTEGMTFAQPDGLPRREAELFWRGTRLIRRRTAKGGSPDALIADIAMLMKQFNLNLPANSILKFRRRHSPGKGWVLE